MWFAALCYYYMKTEEKCIHVKIQTVTCRQNRAIFRNGDGVPLPASKSKNVAALLKLKTPSQADVILQAIVLSIHAQYSCYRF